MKKMLVLVFAILATIGLFAENDYDNESSYSENSNDGFSGNGSNGGGRSFYIQPTFGISAGFSLKILTTSSAFLSELILYGVFGGTMQLLPVICMSAEMLHSNTGFRHRTETRNGTL